MIDPNEEVPKIAKPVEAPEQVECAVVPLEEFIDWVLSLPPDFKQTPEGLEAARKALGIAQPTEK